MKTAIKKENYSSPAVDVRDLELTGFLCTSDVDMNFYVDEDENMGETSIDIYIN